MKMSPNEGASGVFKVHLDFKCVVEVDFKIGKFGLQCGGMAGDYRKGERHNL
jgi:hypothetical protein